MRRAGYPRRFYARQGLKGWCQGVLGWRKRLLRPTTQELKTWIKREGVSIT